MMNREGKGREEKWKEQTKRDKPMKGKVDRVFKKKKDKKAW